MLSRWKQLSKNWNEKKLLIEGQILLFLEERWKRWETFWLFLFWSCFDTMIVSKIFSHTDALIDWRTTEFYLRHANSSTLWMLLFEKNLVTMCADEWQSFLVRKIIQFCFFFKRKSNKKKYEWRLYLFLLYKQKSKRINQEFFSLYVFEKLRHMVKRIVFLPVTRRIS